MSEVIVKERPSSIEVSENAKKQFSYKVKIYFDEDAAEALNKTEEIYKELHRKFR